MLNPAALVIAHALLAQTPRPRLILVSAPLNYEVQQDRGSLTPGEGKRFVGVVLVKPDTNQVRFLADSAILATDSAEALVLTAFCADSLAKDCVPLKLLHPGQILGAYGEHGEGYSLVQHARTRVVTLARRGPKGTPYVLIFEVPVAATQFTLRLGGAPPVMLRVGGRPTG